MKYLVHFKFAGLQWGIAKNVTSSLCHSRGPTCEAQGSEQVLTGEVGGWTREANQASSPFAGANCFFRLVDGCSTFFPWNNLLL